MAYTNCPQCDKRLVVPDNAKALKLRCPACRHTFQANASASMPEDKLGEPPAAVLHQPPSRGNGDGLNDEPFNFSLESGPRILSAADEAMLRDLGSGSGLLELTREALELQAGERSRGALSADPEPPPGDMTDRQFQVVGTALTMANRLVMVYKGELARARRLMLVAWIAVALVAVLSFVVLSWGMSKSTDASVQRSEADGAKANAVNLRGDVANYKEQIAKLAADLDTARADARKLQADLSKANDELMKAKVDFSESQSAAKISAASLQAANQRVSDLEAQIQLLKSPTTAPADSTKP